MLRRNKGGISVGKGYDETLDELARENMILKDYLREIKGILNIQDSAFLLEVLKLLKPNVVKTHLDAPTLAHVHQRKLKASYMKDEAIVKPNLETIYTDVKYLTIKMYETETKTIYNIYKIAKCDECGKIFYQFYMTDEKEKSNEIRNY
jgi:hypothetical protein